MKGVCLTFYTCELVQHNGILLYQWILAFAKENQIHGGSVFRGIAGYGSQGIMHESHFFELASDVPVEIRFVVTKEESERLIRQVKEEKIKIFYSLTETEFFSIV